MERCRACGSVVDELHRIPPDVLTRAVIRAIDDDSPVVRLELCADCLEDLAAGEDLPDPTGSGAGPW
jgi:hypothetical protein